MGSIFLTCSLIAIFLVVFWSIHIEQTGDKTTGFLGLTEDASETLSAVKKSLKSVINSKLNKKNKNDAPVKEKNIDVPAKLEKKSIIKSNQAPTSSRSFKNPSQLPLMIDLPKDKIISEDDNNLLEKKKSFKPSFKK